MRIAESDGNVDTDFPKIDLSQLVGQLGFSNLTLIGTPDVLIPSEVSSQPQALKKQPSEEQNEPKGNLNLAKPVRSDRAKEPTQMRNLDNNEKEVGGCKCNIY